MMGLLWNKADAAEEEATRRIHHLSRRGFLSSLVLSALLLLLGIAALRGTGTWFSAALGGVFVWSLVVCGYTLRGYLTGRSYFLRKSKELGVTDSLTGLPNRRGLVAALERLDVGPQEFGRRVRLVDVDLLNLNRVNYEFGQMVGDAVLQDIGELLREKAPEGCVVGRLGGDEFLVIMPHATESDARSLADDLEEAVSEYTLSLGDRGEVEGVKAAASVADYLPEKASLHETVISAKEASAHGRILGHPSESDGAYYHVPRVTLGAFAAHRWQALSPERQEAFKMWKRAPGNKPNEEMITDVLRLLEEKAEAGWADFVTAVPAPGSGRGRPRAARLLAEAIAERLDIPYRDVMRVDASGPEDRTVQPAVDAVIDKGEGVLLVSDVISSGIVERRCVKSLSGAGAHVLAVAWAAY
jgi:diguanylate cyclase (GGDEF)-like protein